MNKNELISAISQEADLTKADASKALDSMIGAISCALSQGQDVRLAGFGNFSISERAARTGRNPRTGGEINIPASKVVKFKAGKALKENANK